jgi:hypothetical protein
MDAKSKASEGAANRISQLSKLKKSGRRWGADAESDGFPDRGPNYLVYELESFSGPP